MFRCALYLVSVVFALLLCSIHPAFAQIQEYPGDGVDNLGTNPTPTLGVCPSGYVVAIDQVHCDVAAPAPDFDRDRYPSIVGLDMGFGAKKDCNDKNKAVKPGYVGPIGYADGTSTCAAGQYHTCQDDGTFTACTSAVYCEAGVGHECYYVMPAAAGASDSNDGLAPTVGGGHGPWLTAAKPNTLFGSTIDFGDYVYYGDGTYTTTSLSSGKGSVILARRSGTSTSGATMGIKAYPGNHPVISGAGCTNANGCSGILVWNYPNVEVSGFEITGGWGSGLYIIARGDNLDLHDNNIHHTRGFSWNNPAGVSINSDIPNEANNVILHHNWVHNNMDWVSTTVTVGATSVTTIQVGSTAEFAVGMAFSVGNSTTNTWQTKTITGMTGTSFTFVGAINVSAGDEITATADQNSRQIVVFRNKGLQVLANTIQGHMTRQIECVGYKHSDGDNTYSWLLKWNYIYDCAVEPVHSGLALDAEENLIDYTNSDVAFAFRDVGGITNPQGTFILRRNTILNTGLVSFKEPTLYYTPAAVFGSFLAEKNVVIHNKASFSGNVDGFIWLCPNGSDAYRTSWTHTFQNNCYYNKAAGHPWYATEFAATTSDNHDCSAATGDTATAGGTYGSFSGGGSWTAAGFDVGSFFLDPGVDIYFRATVGSCSDKGYLLLSEATTSSSTTSSTSLSTTSSSVTTSISTTTTSTGSTSIATTSLDSGPGSRGATHGELGGGR